MLSRVTSALGKFVKPIAASRAQTQVKEKQPEFQRFKKKKSSPDENAGQQANQQTDQQKDPARQEGSNTPAPRMQDMAGASHVSQAFLQLLHIIQHQHHRMMQWLGNRSYDKSRKGQKQIAKSKKGVMLDYKAD